MRNSTCVRALRRRLGSPLRCKPYSSSAKGDAGNDSLPHGNFGELRPNQSGIMTLRFMMWLITLVSSR